MKIASRQRKSEGRREVAVSRQMSMATRELSQTSTLFLISYLFLVMFDFCVLFSFCFFFFPYHGSGKALKSREWAKRKRAKKNSLAAFRLGFYVMRTEGLFTIVQVQLNSPGSEEPHASWSQSSVVINNTYDLGVVLPPHRAPWGISCIWAEFADPGHGHILCDQHWLIPPTTIMQLCSDEWKHCLWLSRVARGRPCGPSWMDLCLLPCTLQFRSSSGKTEAPYEDIFRYRNRQQSPWVTQNPLLHSWSTQSLFLISDHWETRVEMLITQILKLQTSLFLVFVSSQREIHGLQTQVCMEHGFLIFWATNSLSLEYFISVSKIRKKFGIKNSEKIYLSHTRLGPKISYSDRRRGRVLSHLFNHHLLPKRPLSLVV